MSRFNKRPSRRNALEAFDRVLAVQVYSRGLVAVDGADRLLDLAHFLSRAGNRSPRRRAGRRRSCRDSWSSLPTTMSRQAAPRRPTLAALLGVWPASGTGRLRMSPLQRPRTGLTEPSEQLGKHQPRS